MLSDIIVLISTTAPVQSSIASLKVPLPVKQMSYIKIEYTHVCIISRANRANISSALLLGSVVSASPQITSKTAFIAEESAGEMHPWDQNDEFQTLALKDYADRC